MGRLTIYLVIFLGVLICGKAMADLPVLSGGENAVGVTFSFKVCDTRALDERLFEYSDISFENGEWVAKAPEADEQGEGVEVPCSIHGDNKDDGAELRWKVDDEDVFVSPPALTLQNSSVTNEASEVLAPALRTNDVNNLHGEIVLTYTIHFP